MNKILLIAMALIATIAVQAATDYGFYLGGVKVNSDNCNNITGSNITLGTGGYARYTHSTRTLELNNVTIIRSGDGHNGIDNDGNDGLVVKFTGNNTFDCNDDAAVKVQGKKTTLEVVSGLTALTGTRGVYVNNFGTVIFKGPGNMIVTGRKSDKGAIEGHGKHGTTSLDHTAEVAEFHNTNLYIGGSGYGMLDIAMANFYNGNVTFRATNNANRPCVKALRYCNFNEKATLLEPYGATFDEDKEGFILNASHVYNKDILISNEYVALINEANFPDFEFRQILTSNDYYPKGYITSADVAARTRLNLYHAFIADLTGINYFTSLDTLEVGCNDLKRLDIKSLKNLKYLSASNPYNLNVGGNHFTDVVDLRHNTKLEEIYFYDCDLPGIMISNLPNLTTAYLADNNIIGCDLTGCDKIEHLNVANNKLAALGSVVGKTSLKYLNCSNNPNLTKLTLSGCSALEEVNCSNCSLTDITGIGRSLTTLNCSGNKFTIFWAESTSLKKLNLDDNPMLTDVGLCDGTLTNLSVSGCTALKYLDVDGNALTALDLSTNGAIETLRCSTNSLTKLNLTGHERLTYLNCGYNNLGTRSGGLNVDGCHALKELQCAYNMLESLNLKDCKALTTLNCSDNDLTTLNLSNNPGITSLYCCNNDLTQLNVQGCSALNTLYCYSNYITGEAMQTLVSSLPQANNGTFRVLFNTGEGNDITATQVATAKSKSWSPLRFDGSAWVVITAGGGVLGDVDGNGLVEIDDMNIIINIMLGKTPAGNYPAADVDGSGLVDIDDMNIIINIMLGKG